MHFLRKQGTFWYQNDFDLQNIWFSPFFFFFSLNVDFIMFLFCFATSVMMSEVLQKQQELSEDNAARRKGLIR